MYAPLLISFVPLYPTYRSCFKEFWPPIFLRIFASIASSERPIVASYIPPARAQFATIKLRLPANSQQGKYVY